MTDRTSGQVGIREFKAQLSELVGRVQFRGETIAVTKNGKRVAVLVPAEWYDRAAVANDVAFLLQEQHPELLAELLRKVPSGTPQVDAEI